jgi:hypothetical protein
LYIYGGANENGPLDDIFEYNSELNKFNYIMPLNQKPLGREMHGGGIYYSHENKYMLVIGGRTLEGCSDAIYSYDFTKNEWKQISKTPKPICSMGFEIINNKYAIMYGGTDGDKFLNEFLIYNIELNECKILDASKYFAEGLIAVGMAHDGDNLCICAGYGSGKAYNHMKYLPLKEILGLVGYVA